VSRVTRTSDSTALMTILRNYNLFGFHLSHKSWSEFELSALLESMSGNAPEIYLLRLIASRVNERRIHRALPPNPIHAGQLVSVGTVVDVFRYIVEIYCQLDHPGVIKRGVEQTSGQFGKPTVDQPPPAFVKLFPPGGVLRGRQSTIEYLQSVEASPSGLDTVMREIMLLYVSTDNPAFRPYKVLFDDAELATESPYVLMVQGLKNFFATQPPFAPVGLTLFDCLYAPIRACPDSLEGQLEYIRRHWAHFLPAELVERLSLALDILKEERSARSLDPGPAEVLRFGKDAFGSYLGYPERAAFSPDADWMSNVVLIAKSAYVWLYQLSRKYQRDIHLLNDIPDEELAQLARWGFTGLWLIGLWERSTASRKIKQIMGNPEAASSAYSLYDYEVAADLGGEEALQNLKARAWRHGIRLASDIVPNHMGIYSKWMIEHPDWFLQASYPPFPVYQYTGTDLSEDGRVCLQIEDGYWQHRDAAVVFKRIDKWTGDTKYIYHGNDGTSMPWNDTAQLNFLLPEVREAVIQTILRVARDFSIIRFDAAMTLTKRHYQRLWFPPSGEGGAIPSRAEQGMSRSQFEEQMPAEFWREVVDRVAQEVPDTLLMAEAFWLMEGYFVRTLGMHRVYNSAFMNMLKMEENAKYRTTIKNVLEFSPEVIKRFVNFMNNPDERTALQQFGREDKYFGVAVMMVTMPGLPMFGHGQIEGFAEKYGMEYRRSYWEEHPDQELIHRHEVQIFPLMHRRYLFSGSVNFALFDFVTPDGAVDENVFAYSNRAAGERAIILYNNAFSNTRGTIHTSTAINVGEGEDTVLVRRSLGEALALNTSDNCYYAFRDYRSGLEYIRPGRSLADHGLYAELGAYQYHAFLDFREIFDVDGSWRELDRRLSGAGVRSIDDTHREIRLEPILSPYRRFMHPDRVRQLLTHEPAVYDHLAADIEQLLSAVSRIAGATVKVQPLAKKMIARLKFAVPATKVPAKKTKAVPSKSRAKKPVEPVHLEHVIFAWLTVESLGDIRHESDTLTSGELAAARFDQWMLQKVVHETFEACLHDGGQAYWDTELVRVLLAHSEMLIVPRGGTLRESFRSAVAEPVVRDYLEIHWYDDILWLNRERLERLVAALVLAPSTRPGTTKSPRAKRVVELRKRADQILRAGEKAGYKLDKLIQLLT
jgi:glycosidase